MTYYEASYLVFSYMFYLLIFRICKYASCIYFNVNEAVVLMHRYYYFYYLCVTYFLKHFYCDWK